MIFNIRLIMNLFVLGFSIIEDSDNTGFGRFIGKFLIIAGVIFNIISVFNGG